MTCKLMAGDKPLYEQEYYSVGGGTHRVEGLQAARQRPAEIPLCPGPGGDLLFVAQQPPEFNPGLLQAWKIDRDRATASPTHASTAGRGWRI